jgi:hypothetical protein
MGVFISSDRFRRLVVGGCHIPEGKGTAFSRSGKDCTGHISGISSDFGRVGNTRNAAILCGGLLHPGVK